MDFAISLTPPETKGVIGERFDADAGLQYLNARYYDPKLAMFIQPDWFEVAKAGVGTNRYAYSFNDPVNKMDPGGNFAVVDDLAIGFAILGTIALEYSFDYLDDGEINGTGPLGGATAGVITAVGGILFSESSRPGIGHNNPPGGILQDDGSFITPGGTSISNHGARVTGRSIRTERVGYLKKLTILSLIPPQQPLKKVGMV